ncbi:FxsA family membrane protein [Streptomyces sp. NPDC005925]|uniref:FxsA family membrane protein n=1 Tax=Streptomyces sp. NPDC005925 TaxID=3157172 RepID=UPI0033D1A60C
MTTGAQPPTYQARPRRPRVRTILPLGVAAWLVLEIWLLTVVAGASSGLVVFLILAAGVVLGSAVIKRAGRRAFQNLTGTLQQQQGGIPQSASRQGNSEGNGLAMLGGLLLVIPGVVSDAVGLVILLPPVQKAVSRYAERTFERKLREASPGGQGNLGDAFHRARMHRPDGRVVPGEVVRDEPGAGRHEDPGPPLTP